MMESQNTAAETKPTKQESLFMNLGFNIFIPVLVLTRGDRFIEGAGLVLLIALAFPVIYFFYDLWQRKKVNFFSIIGFISVLLTGGVGLLELPRFWFIVKETTIPLIFGLAVLVSLKTRYPLIRTLFFNRSLFDVDRIQKELDLRGTARDFDRLLVRGTLLLALTFLISAGLNWVVANHIVQTEPSVDPIAFNAEVGRMTAWSWVVIALPSTAMMMGLFFYLLRGATAMTGLTMDDMLSPEQRAKELDRQKAKADQAKG